MMSDTGIPPSKSRPPRPAVTDDGEEAEGHIRTLMERTRKRLDKRGEAMADAFLERMKWPGRAAGKTERARGKSKSGEIDN